MTLFIAYILNIIDYLFTSYWVSLYGISIEGNPLGRWLYQNNLAGIAKIFVVGGFFAVLGICIHLKPKLAWVSAIPCVVYGAIVIYHLATFAYIKIF